MFISYLLVCHELDGSLWGNFQYVDTVPPPQGCDAALFNHLLEPADQADRVGFRSVNL